MYLKKEIRRLARFITVGVAGMFLNLGILFLLTEITGLWYMFSAIIAGVINVIFNYLGNNFWSFRENRNKNLILGGMKFAIVTGLYFILYFGLLMFFTEILGLWYMISAVLAIIIAFTPKYLLCYFWVWRVNSWKVLRHPLEFIKGEQK